MLSPSRAVHFNDACVLIPEPLPRSRVPNLIARSSSLIFKRRHSHERAPRSPTSDTDPPTSPTFPRPALSRKHSTASEESPPPTAPAPAPAPAPPIHRHPSLTATPRARARRPSLPLLPPTTVPLRPCCPDCYPATEDALEQGANWTEKFTRAARRRRSASADYPHPHPHVPCAPHALARVGSPGAIQWSVPAPDADAPVTAFAAVTVDEADRAGRAAVPAAADGDYDDDDPTPPALSPIPSANPSTDDLLDSAPPSPLPPTPPTVYIAPPAPRIAAAPGSPRGSPRLATGGGFRLPTGAALMRAGVDILKGVSVLSGAV
ncbi:hypothetical protein BC834DRAFT_454642 [Gloeopeniophorella convolvens]|nr:hypothetical protein BC834DRAFT_454642 [Gloeopeniophorella convolvens]